MSAVQYYISRLTMISEHLMGTLLPDETLRGVTNLREFSGIRYCCTFLSYMTSHITVVEQKYLLFTDPCEDHQYAVPAVHKKSYFP